MRQPEPSLENPPLTAPLPGTQPPVPVPEFEDPQALAGMPSAGSLQGRQMSGSERSGRRTGSDPSRQLPRSLWLALVAGLAAAALVAVILLVSGVI
jgi:hypothetical protein